MGTKFKEMPRWAQWLGGGAVLAIAGTAGATGLAINVLHGLEVSIAAAILFGLADLTKIVLPIVAGLIGWTKQMRITALVCVGVSIWCASNAYLDGAGARLADKQHGADQYAAAQAGVTKIEKEVADLDARAAQEAKNGGCGKNCKYLGSLAEQRRHELADAKQVLKNAKPVATSGYEKLKAVITAGLFLLLIECLVWLSVPAMTLLRQERKTEEKKSSPIVAKLMADALEAKPIRTREQRSQAAKKGWETRRAKQASKWTTIDAYLEPEKV